MDEIKVRNTKTMAVLLDALKIRSYEWNPVGDKIVIELNLQQLMYTIVAAEAEIQHIFGKTEEWKELTDYINFK